MYESHESRFTSISFQRPREDHCRHACTCRLLTRTGNRRRPAWTFCLKGARPACGQINTASEEPSWHAVTKTAKKPRLAPQTATDSLVRGRSEIGQPDWNSSGWRQAAHCIVQANP